MKKSFREYHLFKIVQSKEFLTLPLDGFLSSYFRKNKAIGSKDRKHIAEKIYNLVRWQGLVDHFCVENSWEERVKVLENINLKKLIADTNIPFHIRVSFPKTFYNLILEHYGEEKAQKFCLASNTKAPTTVRVNVLKTDRQTLLKKWGEKFSVTPTKNSVFGLHFEDKKNFYTLEDFRSGHFEVQDEASQLVANLVEAKPGDHVLDYCAGSGGKTLAFAHRLQGKGQLYLHDIREKPLVFAKRRLKRAGIENAQIFHTSSNHLKKLLGKMDWVLVDAPCSGSGTFRRNPDLKWKFSEELLERLKQEQRSIFKKALTFLKPGGKIVYATCSVLPQENEEQLAFFQQEYSLTLSEKPFHSIPTVGGMDGFFGCVFKLLEN